MGRHLDEEELVAYGRGQLEDVEAERLQSHLLRCDRCLTAFKDVVDFFGELREGEETGRGTRDSPGMGRLPATGARSRCGSKELRSLDWSASDIRSGGERTCSRWAGDLLGASPPTGCANRWSDNGRLSTRDVRRQNSTPVAFSNRNDALARRYESEIG
jgi:anti-sigma factor RsiW